MLHQQHMRVRNEVSGNVNLWGFYSKLGYIVFCTVQWNPVGLLRIIVLLPILLLGLAAWVKGFRHGCRMADREKAI